MSAGGNTDSPDWPRARAPSLAEFEAMAYAIYQRLPDQFRGLCEDLIVQVDNFATDEVIDHMGIEDRYNLLGLFQGVGLPFRSVTASGQMPNLIWLYRRPILAYWVEHDETLEGIVTHVLVHEIGHHFGLSDDDIERIEANAG